MSPRARHQKKYCKASLLPSHEAVARRGNRPAWTAKIYGSSSSPFVGERNDNGRAATVALTRQFIAAGNQFRICWLTVRRLPTWICL